MKRFISTLLTVATLAGVLLVTAGASANQGSTARVYPPAQGCQSLDIPSNSNPGWIWWRSGYFQYGTFRLANGCANTFTYWGDGLRSNNNLCVMVRLSILGNDWTWDYTTSPIEVCGAGSGFIHDSRMRPNDRFWIEAWATDLSHRVSNDWPDGRARF